MNIAGPDVPPCTLHEIRPGNALPPWLDLEQLAVFFHETMKPYEDTVADVRRGLQYALSAPPHPGGFILVAEAEGRLLGALVMLSTGMGGYVPENLLLFVSVQPEMRNRGLGAKLVQGAVERCQGSVKLHVEYDNAARHLYERLGFVTRYAEMRLAR